MKSKQEILIKHFREGHSIRKISRDLGIHRKTVTKYVENYCLKSQELQQLPSSNSLDQFELQGDLCEKPTYNSQNREKIKITPELISDVKHYLRLNEQKRISGQRKQQMRKIDIYEQLRSDGFNIGYTSICNLIRALEQSGSEAFIRQHYYAGDICEFDWGLVKINTSNGIEKYQLAVFTSAYSNYRYARLFKQQDTQSFQQSHVYFINYVGGVYKTFVYDNMKVAVKKFVGFTEKEATNGLLQLSTYYNFAYRFCNVRKGNEKGHVERSVEYIRRKAFSKRDTFSSLAEANIYLEEVCDFLNNKQQKENNNKSAFELFQDEQVSFYPKKPSFECGEKIISKVDKYSTISYKTCRYSVPDHYVGKVISAKVYPDILVCYADYKRISVHSRLHGLHDWSIKIEHYTKTLKRKPGALSNSLAMNQIDKRLHAIYKNYFINREKEFIDLIEYISTSSITIDQVDSAIKGLHPYKITDVTIEKIKIICSKERDQETAIIIEDEINKMCCSQLIQLSQLLPEYTNIADTVEVL